MGSHMNVDHALRPPARAATPATLAILLLLAAAPVLAAPVVAASTTSLPGAPLLAASSAAAFDLAAIPAAQSPLPAFPFVDWPASVPAEARSVEREVSLDALTVIAGAQLLTVEGRLERRRFAIPSGKSPLEMRRHYRDGIKALGGVQVNRLQPINDVATVTPAVQALFPADAEPAVRLGLHSYDEGQYQYEVYVVRTMKANAWFVVQSSTYTVIVTTLEEAVE